MAYLLRFTMLSQDLEDPARISFFGEAPVPFDLKIGIALGLPATQILPTLDGCLPIEGYLCMKS
jgi:hypothetical protein